MYLIEYKSLSLKYVMVSLSLSRSPKPSDSFFIHDPENGGEDSNVALEKLRDVIAQCILPQAGQWSEEVLTNYTFKKYILVKT